MTQQSNVLNTRDEWKLGAGITVFEWEADNRDCYFYVRGENTYILIIFYGWDNTLSMILHNGSQEITRVGHRLPAFKVGLFYNYKCVIDSNTGLIRCFCTSTGMEIAANMGTNYF